MIDIESDIYTSVKNAILANHPNVSVSDEYISDKAKLPAVTIIETSNRVLNRMRTKDIENAVVLAYDINIYSNKVKGKKAECKAIAETVNEAMENLYFTRTYLQQVPNLYNSSIYRIVGRYEAIVGYGADSDKYIIYQSD